MGADPIRQPVGYLYRIVRNLAHRAEPGARLGPTPLWALLDVATIVVLVSGLYLWLARHRRAPVEERLATIAGAHATTRAKAAE